MVFTSAKNRCDIIRPANQKRRWCRLENTDLAEKQSQLTVKTGILTLRTSLPDCEQECAEKIRSITAAASKAPNIISVSVSGINSEKFVSWETLYCRKYSAALANSFALGALFFVMLFRRPPEDNEMTLHRQINYGQSAFSLSDSFAVTADDYLRHSLAISPVCRHDAGELLNIADNLTNSTGKKQIHNRGYPSWYNRIRKPERR